MFKCDSFLCKSFDPENWYINTIAGSSVYGYAGDGGPAINALLNSPQNVYVDRQDNIYISDLTNAVIRRIDAQTGIITTVAGNGNHGYSGDNGPANQASIAYAFHTVVDEEGNLFISDLANNRIRMVNKKTGIITTIAGTGFGGFNGDGNTALTTNLTGPFGIAFDKKGDLLIVDEYGLRVRKMNMKSKIISTVAGYGGRGYFGDGGLASQAMFDFIWNITVDQQSGDIYVNDQNNYRIRKIDAKSGIITTFAGMGYPGNSGLGGPALQASFTQPAGIAFNQRGDLFITDQFLSQIYVVDKKTHFIHLIAGNGTNGFYGDGGPVINSILSHPNSLSTDKKGNIYVCDADNNRIRKISEHK